MRLPPIAVLNEHPEWQRRLYDELRRRDLALEEIALHDASFDPAKAGRTYGLVVNRASPSAANRGHASAIFFAQHVLDHFESLGVRVINGRAAYQLEASKARQAALLQRLGVRYPARSSRTGRRPFALPLRSSSTHCW